MAKKRTYYPETGELVIENEDGTSAHYRLGDERQVQAHIIASLSETMKQVAALTGQIVQLIQLMQEEPRP